MGSPSLADHSHRRFHPLPGMEVVGVIAHGEDPALLVLEGGGTVRTAMIVTTQPEAISKRIIDELVRGATILEGTGAYTGNARPVVYCVITRAEVASLKAIVHEIDPRAFMVIGVAHEALGEGFRPLKQS